MAPMTRCRALNHIPNDLMAIYYEQRAGAGLIITEGTSPSPDGLGYARTPGIYSKEQIEGWKKVTESVHKKGGKIFLQIMHVGRVGSPLNKPEGSRTVAPSAIRAEGMMWTDQEAMVPLTSPESLTEEEIALTLQDFVQGAKNAMEAGFDGVELHGANGYLIEQFINPKANQRTDEWGGSVENRIRFALELTKKVGHEIGSDKTGIRLSPFSTTQDLLSTYAGMEEEYFKMATAFEELGLAYVHLVDHSSMGNVPVPPSFVSEFRRHFKGTLIFTGGNSLEKAKEDVDAHKTDLIGFGRPFISNPDLVERFAHNHTIAPGNADLFYAPGKEGYTDYPFFEHKN